MDKLKQYVDDLQVMEQVKQGINQQFPETPESSPGKESHDPAPDE